MTYHGNINIVQVTQKELLDMIENETHVIRTGATINDEKRASQYEREGYSGTMYVAHTQNMNMAENRLLESAAENNSCKWNVQQTSNKEDDKGYVYVIKGKRYT